MFMEEPEVPTEHLHEEIHTHAAPHGQPWTLGVALSSALLASLAAVASLSAGHYANEAMMLQVESANQWSYFQSKSIKEAQLVQCTSGDRWAARDLFLKTATRVFQK